MATEERHRRSDWEPNWQHHRIDATIGWRNTDVHHTLMEHRCGLERTGMWDRNPQELRDLEKQLTCGRCWQQRTTMLSSGTIGSQQRVQSMSDV